MAKAPWSCIGDTALGEAAFDSERRLRLAMDAGRMAIWEYDIPGAQIVATDDLNRLLGFPAGRPLKLEEIRDYYFPGEDERLRRAALEALEARRRYLEIEYRAFRPDGELRWYQMRAEFCGDKNGSPEKMLGVLWDVTFRKDTERRLEEALVALRKKECTLNAALEAGALALFDFDLVARTVAPSTRLNLFYGYPVDHRLTFADMQARYHPEDREREIAELAAQQADPDLHVYEIDLRLLLPDGRTRWLHGRGEYLRDDRGRARRSRGVVMDATARKEFERTQGLMMRELDHRIKNTLTMVTAIANRTLREAPSLAEAEKTLGRRIAALADTHDLLTRYKWEVSDIGEVARTVLKPLSFPDDRIAVAGPALMLDARRSLALSLALHELATNAVKYGALSVPSGQVALSWRYDPQSGEFHFEWLERGGPPVVPPVRRGFGSQIIETILAQEFAGTTRRMFEPEGVRFCLSARLVDATAAE